MWRQEMLPSILHGCHCDTLSRFCPWHFWSDLVRVKKPFLKQRTLIAFLHRNSHDLHIGLIGFKGVTIMCKWRDGLKKESTIFVRIFLSSKFFFDAAISFAHYGRTLAVICMEAKLTPLKRWKFLLQERARNIYVRNGERKYQCGCISMRK
jgi:hypothetical protein